MAPRSSSQNTSFTHRPARFDVLFSHEIRWRDRQRFLESKGYMLRPRLRPGWVPSWLETGKHPLEYEDSSSLPFRRHLVDATRISDGKLVYIKRVETGDQESSIATMLSSSPHLDDPRNHSVPIIDQFVDSEDECISYIVMPFLREVDDPDLETVGDVVEFVDQILEGLVFLHESGVAHRDCVLYNMMMDASSMYPQGFHPIQSLYLPDGFTPANPIPRSQSNVRYYFIDYGISSYFPSGQTRGRVIGTDGRDQDVPELSDLVPYDPFAVDVFIMGNVFKKDFVDRYTNVGFLTPLIAAATNKDPSSRPSAQGLLQIWTARRQHISSFQAGCRVRKRKETIVESVVLDCISIAGSAYDFFSSWWSRN